MKENKTACIMIVDDSPESRLLIETYLRAAGYTHIMQAGSALECYELLNLEERSGAERSDLIIMDILMPQTDGIAALKTLKAHPVYRDVPVLMVTVETGLHQLDLAFSCGATDYMTKPLKQIELLARVRSALKLKTETDCRKDREKVLRHVTAKLTQSNNKLRQLTELDGLTGIANRRRFDEVLVAQCEHYPKLGQFLSFVMIDIDCFKAYNDTYGHQQGDWCLQKVAQLIQTFTVIPQLAARYGGEEFAVILPDCTGEKAVKLAETMRYEIEQAKLVHEASPVASVVTVSCGVVTVASKCILLPAEVIALADKQLYLAKQQGRNQVKFQEINENTNIIVEK